MAKFPCKGCVPPKRHPACHDTCKEYLDAKALDQQRKDADRGKKDAARYTVENMIKNYDRNVKKKRSGRLTYSRKG